MNNSTALLEKHLPLVGILRGLETQNAVAICQALIDEGFGIIEVPLNSPNALESIRLLVETFGDEFLIGAGTVTTEQEAKDVIATGAKLIVTPNYNQAVVQQAVANDCVVLPGVITPTEAFNAIADGATGLKLFPVTALGLEGFKALKSVLPAHVKCFPVGGIESSQDSMSPLLNSGAYGFGIGSSLFKPSLNILEVKERARKFVEAFNSAQQK